jgi:hypothetical protein
VDKSSRPTPDEKSAANTHVSLTAQTTRGKDPIPRNMQENPEIAAPVESHTGGNGTHSDLIPQLATEQAAMARTFEGVVKAGKLFSSALQLPTEVIKEFLEGSQSLAKSLTAILSPGKDMWSPLQKSIQMTGSSMAQWVATWNLPSMKQWEESMRQFSEAVKDLPVLAIKFKTTLMAFHWPPPTMDFDFADMRYVVEAHDSLSPREAEARIDTFMLERHDSDYVCERLDHWKHHKWIRSRIPILTAVVNAHNQGLYELSIPALLPQIEGIIWEGYGHHDQVYQKKEKELAEKLCSDGLDFLDQAASDFFVNTLLQQFRIGQPVPGLSRHAILHGIDTHYATVTNSLKLILLFDYLLNAFGAVSLANSTTYHKLGCPHVQRSASQRTVYSSHTSAQSAGKKPCKSCHPEHL